VLDAQDLVRDTGLLREEGLIRVTETDGQMPEDNRTEARGRSTQEARAAVQAAQGKMDEAFQRLATALG